MASELLTSFEIAERLELFTTKDEPHIKLVNEIINELGIKNLGRKGNYYMYPSSVLPEIRHWFYYSFDELPKFINMQSVKYERMDNFNQNIP